MRIAIVTETYPPEINGVALTVAGLVAGLIAGGHQVQVIRPRQATDSNANSNEELVLVRGFRMPRYAGLQLGMPSQLRLTKLWKHRRPDAMYVATEGPLGASALSAASALRIPACSGFHTRFDDFARHYGLGFLAPFVFAYLRRFHNRADTTLVPTAELKSFLDCSGFRNVALLRRGVDGTLFSPLRRSRALRKSWGLEEGQLAVIHVGRLAAEKNLPLCVAAFRKLQAYRPTARFICVGDGPERSLLAARNPDFIFTGMLRGEELARHYASADLFVFPSLTETFGNVTLEALASGVPVVAFDYGAAHEHLNDACGRRVALGNEPAFVQATVELGMHDDERLAMRTVARDVAMELAPQAVAAAFARLLKQTATSTDKPQPSGTRRAQTS